MRIPEPVRKLLALAAETAGSLLLVLALFWLFIVFLYALFPSGSSLRDLVALRAGHVPARDAAGRRPEAELESLVRDVRCRRGNSVAWGDAREGMLLYNHDAVQTFDRSGATITFAPGDLLSIGSNSMVVVTRLNETVAGGPRAYRIDAEGELRGTFSASKSIRMELAAAGHLARVVPGKTSFRLTRNGEDCQSLAVYAGELRVATRDGAVRVPAYYGITLRRGAPAGPAVPLPESPRLKDEKLLYRYRLLPPRVRFTWSGGSAQYRFQLARDPRFRSLVLDRRVAGQEFASGTLEAGSYFWRVSGIEEEREGRFSRTGRCELRQLLAPPALAVDFPPQKGAPGPCRVTGSAEAGSRVFVNGVEVAANPDGSFSHELSLRPGVNLIRVEAVDMAGNASYASRVVYGSE